MNYFSTALLIFCYFLTGKTERCFECSSVDRPSDCKTLIDCGPDKVCSVQQFVTSAGFVKYSVGCMANTTCQVISGILGRRAGSDIVTCTQCCSQPLCNDMGCGETGLPVGQRGPYCYTCSATTDPGSCTEVSACTPDEECLVFVAPFTGNSTYTAYKSMCETKTACTTLAHLYRNSSCPPICCATDFCNNQCGTPAPVETCPSGYQFIQDHVGGVKLCVKIHTDHKDWDSARVTCQSEGADLVVLDTTEKALLVKHSVLQESAYTHQSGFWIGARDFSSTNTFEWVNNASVDLSQGDWDVGQPNHFDGGHIQDCACLWRGNPQHYFQWHDDYCSKSLAYVCQKATP